MSPRRHSKKPLELRIEKNGVRLLESGGAWLVEDYLRRADGTLSHTAIADPKAAVRRFSFSPITNSASLVELKAEGFPWAPAAEALNRPARQYDFAVDEPRKIDQAALNRQLKLSGVAEPIPLESRRYNL